MRASIHLNLLVLVGGILIVSCVSQEVITTPTTTGSNTSSRVIASAEDQIESNEEQQEPNEEQQEQISQPGKGPQPLANGAMTYSKIEGLIYDSQNPLSNLDQVPALLPKNFLSNFTLKRGEAKGEKPANGPRGHLPEGDVPGIGMHTMPLAPRAFLFDPNTGFIISYNSGYEINQVQDGVDNIGRPKYKAVENKAALQQGGQDLDTLSFDFTSNTFELAKIDFSRSPPFRSTENCTKCHGNNDRPIFSMYPDWPRFYGSDNDEMLLGRPGYDGEGPAEVKAITDFRKANQQNEYASYTAFKDFVVGGDIKHPRYTPFYHKDVVDLHGFPEEESPYPSYPFRSDVEKPGAELDDEALSQISRSFTRRSGLRFNLLTHRLLVKQVTQKIITHPRFREFGPLFTYNVMRCGVNTNGGAEVMNVWKPKVMQTLMQVEAAKTIDYHVWNDNATSDKDLLIPRGHYKRPNESKVFIADGRLMSYGDNLALFDLKINDVDMRFTYYHKNYLPENAYNMLCNNRPPAVKGEVDYCSDQVMNVGYLQNFYFNSYNDGSTTFDEHITAQLMLVLAGVNYPKTRVPSSEDVITPNKEIKAHLDKYKETAIRGLLDKYQGPNYENRLTFDRPFFKRMDEYSKWFSLPYPNVGDHNKNQSSFQNLHHRAPFYKKDKSKYQLNYEGACEELRKILVKGPQ